MNPTAKTALLSTSAAAVALALAAAVGLAQSADKRPARPAKPAPTAASVKAPKGWDVSIFAAPPEVNYPTTVCALPNGDVFVAIDEMGSLGREKGRGRVVRLRDKDNDGKADEVLTVAKMDNPRGVWVDGNAMYVLHPPAFEKYVDDNGDGVYDRSEVLVKGVSTEDTLTNRGPDHTTNGFRVGPDGWAYIAMGDFGALKAVGKDGTAIQVHGGGIVRVRLDGSGLETYSFGQRNIYDVGIDPFGNVFTRDNTNDGGGWNVRLSHVVPTANFGYPRLFVRFGDEIVQPLNDYGGGSPCGALWVDEPGLPASVQGLLTVEWGASKVYHHPLTAKGAGYEPGTKQEVFLDLQRPTDIDYDGRGSFYVTSWANGMFNYEGPNVGYLAKVTAKGYGAGAVPDVAKLKDTDLVGALDTPSMKARELAQREIVRRGDKLDASATAGLEGLATDAFRDSAQGSPPVKVVAIFTLKQLRGEKANDLITKLTRDHNDLVREVALRALADKVGDATAPIQPFLDGCKDKNPRVRLIAVWGAARLGRPKAVAAVLPLAGDEDPLVAHVAVNALVTLKAVDACLAAINPSDAKLTTGVLRALQQMHETKVVDGLAAKLKELTDAPTRSAVYRALARLHFREADWKGDWWGTRPDTSGPYYKTAEWAGTVKVRAVLEAALHTERGEQQRQLVIDIFRHKIASPAVAAYVAAAAKTDPAFRAMLVDQLANTTGRGDLAADQVKLLREVSLDAKAETPLRAKAIRALSRNPRDAAALAATVDALAAIVSAEKPQAELAGLLDETVRDAKYAARTDYFAKLTTSDDPAKRELAYTFLIGTATGRLSRGDAKAQAAKVIEAGWEKPKTAASLLRAVGRTKAADYRDFVEAMAADPDADVVRAAAFAAGRLGLKTAGVAAESREPIEKVGYDATVALVLKDKGDPAQGKEVFTKVGCVGCHTVSPDEPPKGPFLGGIATRYTRAELCESIMKPSAKIAQGFETQWFKDKNEDVVEGFVTREGGDDLELRNAAGIAAVLKKADITKRGKRETSIMPDGLVAKLSPKELSDLLAYVEGLKGK